MLERIEGQKKKKIKREDTDFPPAGQERFRSISRLYYRGAHACILCYSITDAASFAEMGIWLNELRQNLPPDVVLHVVGTKADIVARDPTTREVPFERCIAYVAENLAPGLGSTPPPSASGLGIDPASRSQSAFTTPGAATGEPRSPSSKRSSGFWGQEVGWDACHEISAESGEGVDEVFRVVTRKLVERDKKMQLALLTATAKPGSPGYESGMDGGYFEGLGPRGTGSFRVGRDRRSWLFPQAFSPVVGVEEVAEVGENSGKTRKGCC